MNKYLVFVVVVLIIAGALFFVFYNKESSENNELEKNPIVIKSKSSSGAPTSPGDVTLLIIPFSKTKTSWITVRLEKKDGMGITNFEAKNVKSEIILPRGIKLIEGDLVWTGEVIWEDVAQFKAKINVIEVGEWTIKVKTTSDFNSFDQSVYVYILAKEDGSILVSDSPFTTPSSDGMAQRIE